MNAKLSAIEMDVSIQCRAAIDTATVNDYAERMTEGDKFPPVDLYGTAERAWIGDGWHRIMAARQCGFVEIPATLHAGGRADALRHALGTNAAHGLRRDNADKHRCVEIALREFPDLSNVALSKLCGVSDPFVMKMKRDQALTVRPSEDGMMTCCECGKRYGSARGRFDLVDGTRWTCFGCQTVTGRDGKTYPAHREPAERAAGPEDAPVATEPPAPDGTSAMAIAEHAVFTLSKIGPRASGRREAFGRVVAYCKKQMRRGK